jgi:TldD protein
MMPWPDPMDRRRFLRLLSGAAASGAGLALALREGPLLSKAWAKDATAGPFPMDERLARILLRHAGGRGAGFRELYLENRIVTRISLSESVVESVEEGLYAGCGVRAVDGERTGYAYADSFEEGPLAAAARDAAAIAEGPSADDAGLSFRPQTPPPIVRCLRPPNDVAEDERIGWLRQIDRAARDYGPSVKMVNVDYQDEMLHYLVINSDGLWIEDSLPLIYARVNVIATKDGRRGMGMERISYRRGAEQMDPDAPARAAREAARMALAMLEAQAAPAGEMPVILGSGGGVLFHEAVGHGLEGDSVLRGLSAFAGRVGEKVGAEKVTVIDTGALPDLRGSFSMDDEGNLPQKGLLIEQGILRGFMNDRISARALKVPLSGNGRRQSYRYPPLVRMSNTYIEVGSDGADEMIRETDSGLFARNLGGGEVDTATGNFTFGVLEGYLIEKGKITRPVRGANLVGNGPEIMKRIDRVGADQKFWPGTCGKGQSVPVASGAPTLRITLMTVGGSEEG